VSVINSGYLSIIQLFNIMFKNKHLPAYPGNKLLFHAVQHINVSDTIKLLEQKEADVNAQNVNN
jgi:hypothetical protein